ncbi:MAG TPA: sodium:proton antiporter [Rubrobacteraceae bacterium]|nr:sodium:proton antiporter [Rubrobacteraceae bacterium]
MILALSVVIAVVFGSGTFLIMQRDLLRLVVGIVLVSNSAVLFIIAAGLSRGEVPIYPLGDGETSDPLVQAMALTALVIGSSVAALLLALVYRLYVAHDSVDMDDISDAEMREAERLERLDDEYPEREEEPDEEWLKAEEPR